MIGGFDNDYQEARYVASGGYYDHSSRGSSVLSDRDLPNFKEHPKIWKMWFRGMMGKDPCE